MAEPIDRIFVDVMLPNFLYIGADRCGSTWIFDTLTRHPEIFIPPAKDFYFFDKYYHLGMPWYESQFSAYKGQKSVGDISHDYLYSSDACARIKKDLPDVKLIACIRQPVEKAISAYLIELKHGLVKGDLEAAARHSPEIVEFGFYHDHLKRYIDAFGRERLLVMRFEDIARDPESFVSRMYRFLGVDPAVRPDMLHRKSLPSARARSGLVARAAKQGAFLLRSAGLPNVLGAIKSSALVQSVLYAPLADDEKPKLDAAQRARLWTMYEPEIEKLERLLGEDFGEWREIERRA